jgi:uncharacterized RDD family membrane protein YckC
MAPVVREVDVVRYRVAGFWRRMVAGALDLMLLVPVFALLGLGLVALFGGRVPRLRELGVDWAVELIVGHDPLAMGGLALCALIALMYFSLFHATRGQTVGKQLTGLEVITLAGVRPTVWRALARTAGYLVSALAFGLGFIWIGFDREKRGLHDWLAGTYVVRTRGR